MIEGKNYMAMATKDIPKDIEYRGCMFSRSQCVDVGGLKKGERLFPGDDTPRTFVNCGMVNCEPPPGSTVINCNTAIIERHYILHSETVEIDGESIAVNDYVSRKWGAYNPETQTYDYFSIPFDVPEDI